MKIRGLVLFVAALLASGLNPASATMRISEDRGGQIGHYLETYSMLRTSGEKVVVDGSCLSACTLLLGVIPRDRICATGNARFGFHAAWMPDSDGRPVTSPMGTQALWKVYPAAVRRWINHHGGLSRRMIYLQGRDLAGIIPSCTETADRRQERSDRRYTNRALRYERANAASYRR
ncbi:MAG TPA: hypothetical protein VGJ01_19285 [Pseudolabrys sp.]|jgi:hypothetical protein